MDRSGLSGNLREESVEWPVIVEAALKEPSRKFTPDEEGLLRQLVSQRAPALAPFLGSLGKIPLSVEQREDLRDVLLQEMLERGLDEDDEPNRYGSLLDDMIGRLRHY